MAIELEAMGAHLDRIAADWSAGVDHGAAWGLKLMALKYHVTESAKRVVDLAMTMSGGTGCTSAANSSGCIATCAAVASIRPTLAGPRDHW